VIGEGVGEDDYRLDSSAAAPQLKGHNAIRKNVAPEGQPSGAKRALCVPKTQTRT